MPGVLPPGEGISRRLDFEVGVEKGCKSSLDKGVLVTSAGEHEVTVRLQGKEYSVEDIQSRMGEKAWQDVSQDATRFFTMLMTGEGKGVDLDDAKVFETHTMKERKRLEHNETMQELFSNVMRVFLQHLGSPINSSSAAHSDKSRWQKE